MYTLYILECGDGSLYTGITNDLVRRAREHAMGEGSKYVRARKVRAVVYTEVCTDKSSALKREITVKKMSREEKLALIGAGAKK